MYKIYVLQIQSVLGKIINVDIFQHAQTYMVRINKSV